MKLVMTLLARDEIDIVDSWLAFHLNAGADFVDRDRQPFGGRHDRDPRALRPLRARPPDSRAGRGPAPGRVGDAHGAARGDGVRRGLGDQLRRGRVLVAARRVAARRARRGAGPRYGTVVGVPACLLSATRRRALRRADDRALLCARADQRPGVPLQADPQGRPPRASPDPPHAREPRLGRQPVRSAAGMVSGRVLPLPPAIGEQSAHKAQLQGEAFEKHIARPPTAYHADMFAALTSGRIAEYYESLVVSDEELEQGGRGRLVVDTRLRDALRGASGEGLHARRRSRSRSRRSSRTPSTRSRPRCSARPMWSGSTPARRARGRLQTIEHAPPPAAYRKRRGARRARACRPRGADVSASIGCASRPGRRRSPRRAGRGPRAPPAVRSEAASP